MPSKLRPRFQFTGNACYFFSYVKGVGQNYIVGETPTMHNIPLFIQMIAEKGVKVILTLDEMAVDEPCDIPHWYPKGRIGMRLSYDGYYS